MQEYQLDFVTYCVGNFKKNRLNMSASKVYKMFQVNRYLKWLYDTLL